MRRDKVITNLIMNIHHKYILNEHKKDWRDLGKDELLRLFKLEIKEFYESLEKNDLNNAIKEVADIALFGAYIIDTIKNKEKK